MQQSRARNRVVRDMHCPSRPDVRGKVSCKGTRQMADLVSVEVNGNGVAVVDVARFPISLDRERPGPSPDVAVYDGLPVFPAVLGIVPERYTYNLSGDANHERHAQRRQRTRPRRSAFQGSHAGAVGKGVAPPRPTPCGQSRKT